VRRDAEQLASPDSEPRTAPQPELPTVTMTSRWLVSFVLPLLTAGCVVHPRGPHGPACAAIDAATQVELSSHRLELLTRIAQRPELSQHEQTYLVNAICFGGIGGEHADALIALIQNPCCTAQTRQQIAANLRMVAYSSERRRVAEALAAADTRPTSPGAAHPQRESN